MQNKKQIMAEAACNTASGFFVSMLAWRYITAPATAWYIADFGGRIDDWLVAVLSTLFYTLLSLGRNYAVRWFFNRKHR